jgi:predicted dehydrogenase
MTKDRLGTGVIGLGFFGERHARVHSELPNIDLEAVCDLSAEHGRPIAERLGVDFHADPSELLARDDIEAVSICVPDRKHVGPAVAAAKAGKHILLEKPMAHSGEAAAEIAAAVEAAGVRLMIGHILRFDPRYVQLHAQADPARLGEPIHLRAKRNSVRDLSRRLGTTSSILFYMGVHDVDAMQWVARSPIVRVYAQKVSRLRHADEDALYAIVTFANGAIGVLDYSWAWPNGLYGGYWAALEVVGTKSAAWLDVRDQGFAIIDDHTMTGADTHLWPVINDRLVGDLRDEILHFAEAVLTGAPFVQPWQDALDAVRVLDAIFASIESGAPEEVRR